MKILIIISWPTVNNSKVLLWQKYVHRNFPFSRTLRQLTKIRKWYWKVFEFLYLKPYFSINAVFRHVSQSSGLAPVAKIPQSTFWPTLAIFCQSRSDQHGPNYISNDAPGRDNQFGAVSVYTMYYPSRVMVINEVWYCMTLEKVIGGKLHRNQRNLAKMTQCRERWLNTMLIWAISKFSRYVYLNFLTLALLRVIK